MKVSLAISTLSHVGLFALGLVSLSSPDEFEPSVSQALTVELITESEFSAVASGSLKADVSETVPNPRAAPVSDDQAPTPQLPMGNVTQDIFEANDALIESATPTEESAPVPQETQLADDIEFAAAPPKHEPLPELPVPDEVLTAPNAEIEELVSDKEPQAQQSLSDNVPQLAALPTSVKKLREVFKANQEAARAQQAREAENNSAVNNAERSRGGKTGQGGQQTLGDSDGSRQESLQTALARERERLNQCYEKPVSAIYMSVSLSLDETGNMIGQPTPRDPLSSPEALATFRAVRRAVEKCLPLRLPRTDYANWRNTEIEFEPFN